MFYSPAPGCHGLSDYAECMVGIRGSHAQAAEAVLVDTERDVGGLAAGCDSAVRAAHRPPAVWEGASSELVYAAGEAHHRRYDKAAVGASVDEWRR